MKQTVVFIAFVALAVGVWFLRGNSDASLLGAKDAQIEAMKDTLQAKDHVRVQDENLLDARDTSIKTLQDQIKSDEDLLAKNNAQIEADKTAYERLQSGDQNIINSLKEDNNADIQVLKSQLQEKDDQIAQLNEKLVQAIADFENQLNAARNALATMSQADNGKKIYPIDDGFEQQDVGQGNFTYFYKVESNAIHLNPPPPQPNHTGWDFGGDAGIAANGSFLMNRAQNGNHDGKTSSAGQAAFLQTRGGWFSQLVKLPAGTYSVSFDYESRQNYEPANGIAVSLNGTDLFAGAPTDTNNFAHVTTETVTLAASGKYELKFRGLGAMNDPAGDHTTFIDNVCINVVGTSPHVRPKVLGTEVPYQAAPGNEPDKDAIYPKDNGFDAQDLGVGFFAYQNFGEFHNPNHVPQPTPELNQTPWKFGPSAGIAANGSGFFVANATNGDSDGKKSTAGQAGFLTLDGSSISQFIHLKAGTYVVVFGLEARRGYNPNHISVSLGEKTLFEGVASDTNNFQQIITEPVTFTKSGDYELKFCGHGGTGKFDGDAFIDDVRIRPVDPKVENNSMLQTPDKLSDTRQ